MVCLFAYCVKMRFVRALRATPTCRARAVEGYACVEAFNVAVLRTWLRSVVFPAPKKPERTVTGKRKPLEFFSWL